ncbi:DUF6233 domain-containing protein [Streptomyces sp. SLBN-8D4]|uniref:DUF6233 domain-containing protein n=1 Tax=Streptomyces sp. SLBN-8D4 TaxID=3377728 RepID=UPI003C7C3082
MGAGKPPVQVHAGHCHMIGSRRRPVSRDEARRLLADGLGACTHCQPDTELHIIDLAGRDSNSRTKGLVTLTRGRLVRAAGTGPRHAPCPADHRTGPVSADLPRRQGRPLHRLPAKGPPVRQRRQPAVSVVHGDGQVRVGTERALRQHAPAGAEGAWIKSLSPRVRGCRVRRSGGRPHGV